MHFNRNRESGDAGLADTELVTEQELLMGMLKEPEERDKYTEDELYSIVISYEQILEEINRID